MSSIKGTSRPLGVAESILKRKVDPTSVYSKTVVLTGEAAALSTLNGRACFIDALMLLSRVVGDLVVCVPDDFQDLYEHVMRFCSKAWSIGPLRVVREVPHSMLESSAAILNVGAQIRPGLPWTSINSNGWIARVSSGSKALPDDYDQVNPIAALMSASLGVTEVFKRIFSIPSSVAAPLDRSEISLFELTTAASSLGPDLPTEIHLPNTLLIGGGAIGNGNALLLSQLPVRGRVHIVDKQAFAEENFGTCVLLEKSGWLAEPKACRLAAWLNRPETLRVTGEQETIESALSSAAVGSMNIDLVLNGLDEPAARRTSQRLWPSVLIDGGINEVGAAVTQHRLANPELACLQCWFEPTMKDETALQSSWTGLDPRSLNNLERPLTEEDIMTAAPGKRAWLRERKGKSVCSVITEAQLASRLGIDADDGFRPFVPFVATAASSLVIAEAIKAIFFPQARIAAQFQLGNLFLGPDASISLKRRPSPTCTCRVHRVAIDAIRETRLARVRNGNVGWAKASDAD